MSRSRIAPESSLPSAGPPRRTPRSRVSSRPRSVAAGCEQKPAIRLSEDANGAHLDVAQRRVQCHRHGCRCSSPSKMLTSDEVERRAARHPTRKAPPVQQHGSASTQQLTGLNKSPHSACQTDRDREAIRKRRPFYTQQKKEHSRGRLGISVVGWEKKGQKSRSTLGSNQQPSDGTKNS